MVFEIYDTLMATRSRFIWKLEFLKKIYMKFNFLVTVLWGVFIVSLKNNWHTLLYKLMGYSMMARFAIHTLWNEFLSLLKKIWSHCVICGILVPHQRLIPHPWQWKHRSQPQEQQRIPKYEFLFHISFFMCDV